MNFKLLKSLEKLSKKELGDLIERDLEFKNSLMPRMTKYIPWVPILRQKIFLSLDDVEVFYEDSPGIGKSVALLMAALQWIDIEGYQALLIDKECVNFKDPNGLIYLSHEWLKNTDAQWNEKNYCWKFPSGATLNFDRLIGEYSHFNHGGKNYQFIGINNINKVKEHQALYMIARLRKNSLTQQVPLRGRFVTSSFDHTKNTWVVRRYIDPETRVGDFIEFNGKNHLNGMILNVNNWE